MPKTSKQNNITKTSKQNNIPKISKQNKKSKKNSKSTTPKKLHIIFDLDDTLIHTEPVKIGVTNKLVLKKGMDYTYMTTPGNNLLFSLENIKI